MNAYLKKQKKLVNNYPEIVSISKKSSEIEVVNKNLKARTTETMEAKSNTFIPIHSRYTGESYPPM